MTDELASTYLQWPDYAVIIVYFAAVLGIGLWVTFITIIKFI